MPTDTDKKLNGAPQPFRRPVVWGRPPATVFRAGPLPKGGSLPPLPEPPRMQVGPGILSGSMIPRAAPTPAPTPTPDPAQRQTQAAAPVRPPALRGPASCRAAAGGPLGTVRDGVVMTLPFEC